MEAQTEEEGGEGGEGIEKAGGEDAEGEEGVILPGSLGGRLGCGIGTKVKEKNKTERKKR